MASHESQIAVARTTIVRQINHFEPTGILGIASAAV
jgi:hypothetical protein